MSGSFLPGLGRQPKSTRVAGASIVMKSCGFQDSEYATYWELGSSFDHQEIVASVGARFLIDFVGRIFFFDSLHSA
jgi:hypothetical protein